MSTLYLEGIKFKELKLQLRQMIRECLEEVAQPTNHNKTLPSEKQNLKLLTRKETSKLLSVSLVTLNEWRKKKVLLPVKIHTRVRYRLSDIENAFKTDLTLNQIEDEKVKV